MLWCGEGRADVARGCGSTQEGRWGTLARVKAWVHFGDGVGTFHFLPFMNYSKAGSGSVPGTMG